MLLITDLYQKFVNLAMEFAESRNGAQLVVVILNREKLISEEKANGRHNQSH